MMLDQEHMHTLQSHEAAHRIHPPPWQKGGGGLEKNMALGARFQPSNVALVGRPTVNVALLSTFLTVQYL